MAPDSQTRLRADPVGNVRTFEREERLDRYRRAVEGCLGDRLSFAEADDYRAFFEHVMASFEQDIDAAECARAWNDPPR